MNEYINKYENLTLVTAIGSCKSYISCALSVEIFNATLIGMYEEFPIYYPNWIRRKFRKNTEGVN